MPNRELDWLVIYDQGGRLYPYRRTRPQMRHEITKRVQAGRDLPWRVWVLADGEMVRVEVEE